MKMKRIFYTALFCVTCFLAKSGVTIPYTEIPYNVNYHWGIIDVNIAHGNVTIESDGNSFMGTLDGVSIPWEGHVILVSDTLDFNIIPSSGLSKEKVNYQAGWYRRPKVKYFRNKNYNPGNPQIYKNIAGQGLYNASNDSMEAITVTSDMLAMFYYAHEFNFDSMKPGHQIVIPIDGDYAQEVLVTYMGPGTYSEGNAVYSTQDVQFEYTYGGKLSGYQVQMKIGDKTRLPLFISASLPMGKVEMLYTGDEE